MAEGSAFDSINIAAMQNAVSYYAHALRNGLSTAERVALATVADRVRGGRILDIGMGAGRTVMGLRELSHDYTGVDYAPAMVEFCRKNFPGLRFEHADARNLPFRDGEFDFVVFSCNGISMVDHDGRLKILKEVRRVLSPGGAFLFSSCNSNSLECTRGFTFPDYSWTWNPVRLGVRTIRFARDLVARIRNRAQLRDKEVVCAEYSIVNDTYHNHGVLLYFASLTNQERQLREAGFGGDLVVLDLSGKVASANTTDGTLTFVACA